MRMKRPEGYKHVKCPHCEGKIKLVFRTMHRMKIEALLPKERKGVGG